MKPSYKNKIELTLSDAEIELASILSGMSDIRLEPRNKKFESNLSLRLENLHAAKLEKDAAIRRQQLEKDLDQVQKMESVEAKSTGGLLWRFIQLPAASFLTIAAFLCLTTGTFASYAVVPQVRNSINRIVGLPIYGTLAVQTQPLNVNLVVNGDFVGRTPYIGDLPVGSYELLLTADGYEDVVEMIEIVENQRLDLNFELEELRETEFPDSYPDSLPKIEGETDQQDEVNVEEQRGVVTQSDVETFVRSKTQAPEIQ